MSPRYASIRPYEVSEVVVISPAPYILYETRARRLSATSPAILSPASGVYSPPSASVAYDSRSTPVTFPAIFERPSTSPLPACAGASAGRSAEAGASATSSLCQSSPLNGVFARSGRGARLVFSAWSVAPLWSAPHICHPPTPTSATTERPAAIAIPEKLPTSQDPLLTDVSIPANWGFRGDKKWTVGTKSYPA